MGFKIALPVPSGGGGLRKQITVFADQYLKVPGSKTERAITVHHIGQFMPTLT